MRDTTPPARPAPAPTAAHLPAPDHALPAALRPAALARWWAAALLALGLDALLAARALSAAHQRPTPAHPLGAHSAR